MKILGIQLSKPSFNEITASAIMAAGLWLAIVALWRVSEQPLDRIEAGAALLVVFWGCSGGGCFTRSRTWCASASTRASATWR